jgi:hypothetical protein
VYRSHIYNCINSAPFFLFLVGPNVGPTVRYSLLSLERPAIAKQEMLRVPAAHNGHSFKGKRYGGYEPSEKQETARLAHDTGQGNM